LVNLYNTLIHPYLLYCNIVWGNASLLALKRLIVLQKRRIISEFVLLLKVRIISNSYFRAYCSKLFRNLNILKLQDIHVLQTAVFMYRAKNNLLPLSCNQHVTVDTTVYIHVLRNRRDFRDIRYRRCISIAGPNIWNSIPLAIRESNTLPICKRSLSNLLYNNYI